MNCLYAFAAGFCLCGLLVGLRLHSWLTIAIGVPLELGIVYVVVKDRKGESHA